MCDLKFKQLDLQIAGSVNDHIKDCILASHQRFLFFLIKGYHH